jgi:hypothetical protein
MSTNLQGKKSRETKRSPTLGNNQSELLSDQSGLLATPLS